MGRSQHVRATERNQPEIMMGYVQKFVELAYELLAVRLNC